MFTLVTQTVRIIATDSILEENNVRLKYYDEIVPLNEII